MPQIFKPIKGYEGSYEIGSHGSVKSLLSNKILKPCNTGQRMQVTLSNKAVKKPYGVHRLVAIAFLPNVDGLPEVNHKDNNYSNNNFSNLEWCTSQYNTIHAYANGHNSKAKRVEQLVGNTVVGVYYSTRNAGKETGINNSSIAACCRGTRHTAGTFKWRFKNDDRAN